MELNHQTRIACVGIVAVAAIAALVILIYAAGTHQASGAVATNYCPDGFKPVWVEGSGKWAEEVRLFEMRGGYCVWAADGITPCCTLP